MAFKTCKVYSYVTTENAVTHALHDMSKHFVKPPWLHCLYILYTYSHIGKVYYLDITI